MVKYLSNSGFNPKKLEGNTSVWNNNFPSFFLKKGVICFKYNSDKNNFKLIYNDLDINRESNENNDTEGTNNDMKLSDNKELWSSFIKNMDAKYAIWTNLPSDTSLN